MRAIVGIRIFIPVPIHQVGISLASCPENRHHLKQPKVERSLNKLRKSVTRKKAKPGQECFMEIVPPLNRKATVGFYVHQGESTHLRRKHMEHFAAGALERDDAASCVLFAKNTENWSSPYEEVLLVQRREKIVPELNS